MKLSRANLFAGQSLKLPSVVYLFASTMLPLIWGALDVVLKFLFRPSLKGWDNGIFNWVWAPPFPKFILLLDFAAGLAVTMSMLLIVLYLAKAHVSERLTAALGPFPARAVYALVGLLWLFNIAVIAFKVAEHNKLSYVLMAGQLLIYCAIAVGLYLRKKWPVRCHYLVGLIVVVLGFLPLVWIFVVTPFRVPNEFLSMPAKTIFSDGSQVDNFEFINTRKIDNLHINDPRIDGDNVALLKVGVPVSDPSVLSMLEVYQKQYPELFWLDKQAQTLEIHGRLRWWQYRALSKIVSSVDALKLDVHYKNDEIAARELAIRKYDGKEKEFLRINYAELGKQLVLGRFFYHHAFLYQAAFAQMNGAADVYSQYGRGFTEFLAAAISVMPAQLRFNAYLEILYSSYPIYLAVLLFVAWRMQLSRWSVIFVAACTVFAFIAPDLETVRLGVGLAPWRHMFDIAAIYLLFRYAFKPTLLRAVVLALVTGAALYWSREMGLFLGIGILFGLSAQIVVTRKTRDIFAVLLCLLAVGLGYKLGGVPTVDSPYSLLGVNTPDLPGGFVSILAAIVLSCFSVWVYLGVTRKERTALADAEWVFLGGGFSYAALCGVYLLWYPRIHHLVPILPIISLAVVVMYRQSEWRSKEIVAKGAYISTVIMLLILAATGLLRIYEIHKENRIFKTHVNYPWVMPNARIIGDADPALLNESIRLIDKYNPGARIKILSPWEIALLPMAGKYKTGPFPVYFDSIFSDIEINMLANDILKTSGDMLFIDSRLMFGIYEPTVPVGGYLEGYSNASEQRIGAHASLRYVFEVVKPCFDLVEKGKLISVYRRKGTSASLPAVCASGK